jgi:hypothetical protein
MSPKSFSQEEKATVINSANGTVDLDIVLRKFIFVEFELVVKI